VQATQPEPVLSYQRYYFSAFFGCTLDRWQAVRRGVSPTDCSIMKPNANGGRTISCCHYVDSGSLKPSSARSYVLTQIQSRCDSSFKIFQQRKRNCDCCWTRFKDSRGLPSHPIFLRINCSTTISPILHHGTKDVRFTDHTRAFSRSDRQQGRQ